MSELREFDRGRRVKLREATASIEQLYQAEAPRLLRYFRRNTRNCHSAPDLVQDAFIRLASFGRFAELTNPAAYLQRIARNMLADRARGRGNSDLGHMPLADWEAVAQPTQEDGIIAADMLRLYEKAIADLPERTRSIFLLQRADGLTYRQIARRLDVTLWTVEHHMKRAIAHLDRSFDTP